MFFFYLNYVKIQPKQLDGLSPSRPPGSDWWTLRWFRCPFLLWIYVRHLVSSSEILEHFQLTKNPNIQTLHETGIVNMHYIVNIYIYNILIDTFILYRSPLWPIHATVASGSTLPSIFRRMSTPVHEHSPGTGGLDAEKEKRASNQCQGCSYS